jgi:hypothetical protein
MTPKVPQNLTPAQQRQIRDAAAAAMEETISKSALDAVLNADPKNLITSEPDPDLRKGTAKGSKTWVHAPGRLELLALAASRLVKVSNQQGIPGNRIEKVQAYVIPGSKVLVIKGALSNDLTAITISHRKKSSSVWINCFTALAKAGLTVDTGYMELYNVAYVPNNSPLWPGLLIDFGNRLDRQVEPPPKKKDKKTQPQPNGQSTSGPQGSAAPAPAGQTPDAAQTADAAQTPDAPQTVQQPTE